MVCVICVAFWPPSTPNLVTIAEPFFKYSLVGSCETLYVTRATCQSGPQMNLTRLQSIFIEWGYGLCRQYENQMISIIDITFSKASPYRTVLHTKIIRYLRGFQSAIRALLMIKASEIILRHTRVGEPEAISIAEKRSLLSSRPPPENGQKRPEMV